jgi:hypothetical protein
MSLAVVRLWQQVTSRTAIPCLVARWLTALLPPLSVSLPLSSLFSGVPRSAYDAVELRLPKRAEWGPEAGGTVYVQCPTGDMHTTAQGAITDAINQARFALGIDNVLKYWPGGFTAAAGDRTSMIPDGAFVIDGTFCTECVQENACVCVRVCMVQC